MPDEDRALVSDVQTLCDDARWCKESAKRFKDAVGRLDASNLSDEMRNDLESAKLVLRRCGTRSVMSALQFVERDQRMLEKIGNRIFDDDVSFRCDALASNACDILEELECLSVSMGDSTQKSFEDLKSYLDEINEMRNEEMSPEQLEGLSELIKNLSKRIDLDDQITAGDIGIFAKEAFVVGVSKYPGRNLGLEPLPNAKRDATKFAEKLEAIGFRVERVLDPESVEDFLNARDAFLSRLEPDVISFIFLAGHGFQNKAKNYIQLPRKLSAGINTSHYIIDTKELLEDVAVRTASFAVLVLDTCRKTRTFSKSSVIPRCSLPTDDTNASIIADEHRRKLKLIVYSTASGTGAHDYIEKKDRQGPFMDTLLKFLERKEPVLDMLGRVQDSFRRKAKMFSKAQEPVVENLGGSFLSSKVQISPVENVFSSTAPGDEQKAFGTLSRKLTRAVKEGNLENIKECVRSGGKIEGLDELGYGALHIAVLHGERISLSKHIKGFKINLFCCLMEIKGNRHEHEHLEKIMRYLVKEAKINVDKMDARMQTPERNPKL